MKSNSKKFTHVIRSIEDAVGFDEDADIERYEKFNGTKKNKKVDFEDIEPVKKPPKLRDNRRLDFENNKEW